MQRILPKMAEQAEKLCLSVQPEEKDIYLKDSQVVGLFLRITPNGKKAEGRRYWQLRYFIKVGDDWKQRKTTLGPFRAGRHGNGLTVKQARTEAERIRHAARHQLEDPVADRRTAAKTRAEIEHLEKQTAMKKKTVSDVFARWESAHLQQNHKDGGERVRQIMTNKVLKRYGDLDAASFGKAEFMAIIDEVLAKGHKRTANIVLALTKQMLSFAESRGIIESNPLSKISKAHAGGQDTERDRVLAETEGKPQELNELFFKLPNAGLTPTSVLAVHIVLSTCCRIGELITGRWVELDFARRQWVIPKESSKNGKPFTINLSDYAINQFTALRALTGWSEWLYPSSKPEKPMSEKNVTKQLTDRQRAPGEELKGRTKNGQSLLLPGGHWTPHDLRRTGATLMAELGVMPEVVEKCLNHREQNRMKRTYQLHDYRPQMAAGWHLLGDYLSRIAEDVADRSGSNPATLAIGHETGRPTAPLYLGYPTLDKPT